MLYYVNSPFGTVQDFDTVEDVESHRKFAYSICDTSSGLRASVKIDIITLTNGFVSRKANVTVHGTEDGAYDGYFYAFDLEDDSIADAVQQIEQDFRLYKRTRPNL